MASALAWRAGSQGSCELRGLKAASLLVGGCVLDREATWSQTSKLAGANRLLGGSASQHCELEGGFHDALASALWYNKLPRRAAADIHVPRVRPRYLLSLWSFSKISR